MGSSIYIFKPRVYAHFTRSPTISSFRRSRQKFRFALCVKPVLCRTRYEEEWNPLDNLHRRLPISDLIEVGSVYLEMKNVSERDDVRGLLQALRYKRILGPERGSSYKNKKIGHLFAPHSGRRSSVDEDSGSLRGTNFLDTFRDLALTFKKIHFLIVTCT